MNGKRVIQAPGMDASGMGIDDFAADGQPQSASLGFCGEIGFKNHFFSLLVHGIAPVFKRDDAPVAAPGQVYVQKPPSG